MARALLQHLSSKYQLAVVSLAINEPPQAQYRLIQELGVAGYFDAIFFVAADKDGAYHKALNRLGVAPADTVIVDDRVRRGIRWGNLNGAKTIWIRRGKFANELPDLETGVPTYTIEYLSQLLILLD